MVVVFLLWFGLGFCLSCVMVLHKRFPWKANYGVLTMISRPWHGVIYSEHLLLDHITVCEGAYQRWVQIIERMQDQQCLVVTPQGGMCLLLDTAQGWNSLDWCVITLLPAAELSLLCLFTIASSELSQFKGCQTSFKRLASIGPRASTWRVWLWMHVCGCWSV